MEVQNLFGKIKGVLGKVFGKSRSLQRVEAVAEVLLQESGGRVQEVCQERPIVTSAAIGKPGLGPTVWFHDLKHETTGRQPHALKSW